MVGMEDDRDPVGGGNRSDILRGSDSTGNRSLLLVVGNALVNGSVSCKVMKVDCKQTFPAK